MAEEKSSKGFAKVFSKKVTRTKEKVLHSMGKSDKTKDDTFDEHVTNFGKQQAAAVKIQAELKKYMSAVKNMALVSRSFYETLNDSYEEDWSGREEISGSVVELSTLWENYTESVQSDVQSPFLDYIARFPDMKNKIAKRGRKLVDYDGARHHHSTVTNAKKKDDVKINKAQEELTTSQDIYEDINKELRAELPAMFDSRVNFLSHNMHTLFAMEAKFQGESAKVKDRMAEVADRLNEESGGEGTSYQLADKVKPMFTSSQSRTEDSDESDYENGPGMTFDLSASARSSNNNPPSSKDSESPVSTPRENRTSSHDDDIYQAPENNQPLIPPVAQQVPPPAVNGEDTGVVLVSRVSTGSVPEDTDTYENVDLSAQTDSAPDESKPATSNGDKSPPVARARNSLDSSVPREPSVDAAGGDSDGKLEEDGASVYLVAGAVDDIYTVPPSNAAVELPEGVIFQVIATHSYSGDDTDELSFKTGEIINVIPFKDPEEQDDGWLMGYVTATGSRGVFPQNFTKKM